MRTLWMCCAAALTSALALGVLQQTPAARALSVSMELVDVGMAGDAGTQEGVFRQGRPIECVLTITNESDEAYEYLDILFDRSGRIPEYPIEVYDATGRKLGDPREGHGYMGGAGGTRREIGPGESSEKRVYLNKWVMPLQPGTYTAVGIYAEEWGTEGAPPPVRSEPVEFTIAEVGPEEMQAYIDELGRMVPNSAGERLRTVVDHLAFTGHSSAFDYLNDAMYRGVRAKAYLYAADPDWYRDSLLSSLDRRGPAKGMVSVLRGPLETPLERILPGLAKAIAESIDPEIRAQAAGDLVSFSELGEPALRPLLAAIQDDEPQVRERAASALRFYKSEEATDALLLASADRHPGVRAMAADSLIHREPERSVPRLKEMLTDEREAVGTAAVEALADIGTDEATAALRTGLEADLEMARLRAALALFRLGDDGEREELADALERADRELAAKLTNWLGNAVEKRGLPGPGEGGKPHTTDVQSWVKWLRGNG